MKNFSRYQMTAKNNVKHRNSSSHTRETVYFLSPHSHGLNSGYIKNKCLLSTGQQNIVGLYYVNLFIILSPQIKVSLLPVWAGDVQTYMSSVHRSIGQKRSGRCVSERCTQGRQEEGLFLSSWFKKNWRTHSGYTEP